MPKYHVRITGLGPDKDDRDELAGGESVYASSAEEAEKFVEARAEKNGIDASYFEYRAIEVSSDGTFSLD